MIFNEVYDKSLWLVKYSDKKSREFVADFIESIPDCLCEKIKISTDYACRENLRYREDMHGCVITSNQVMYWYRIDRYSLILTLGYSVCNGNNDYNEVFEMSICPFTKVETGVFNLMVKMNDIGGIGCIKEPEMKCFLITHGQNFIVDFSGKLIHSKYIHANKMPQNVEVKDIRNNSNFLVRRKKLGRNR